MQKHKTSGVYRGFSSFRKRSKLLKVYAEAATVAEQSQQLTTKWSERELKADELIGLSIKLSIQKHTCHHTAVKTPTRFLATSSVNWRVSLRNHDTRARARAYVGRHSAEWIISQSEQGRANALRGPRTRMFIWSRGLFGKPRHRDGCIRNTRGIRRTEFTRTHSSSCCCLEHNYTQ